uniref:Uncharacterized protein n=1 Tax=Escherichia coli TaxID=562 RepID=A0A411KX33_ECOLX|nr:hypothetical protein [Escherichia coli]
MSPETGALSGVRGMILAISNAVTPKRECRSS